MEPINGDSDQRPPADREVHEFFDRARAALNAGDVAQAEQLAGQALDLEPDFLPALELAGVLACQLRMFDRGISRLRRLNELVGDNPGALFNLGNALVSNREFDEGLGMLERADELAPGNPNVSVATAIALRNLGRIEEAASRLEGVIQVAPQHLAALTNLGSCYAQLARFEKASAVFQKAVALSPRSVELRHNAGNMLLELGEYSGAANEYRNALTAEPRNPDSRMGLAMALSGMGEYEEALFHLRKILKGEPDNLHARFAVIDTLEHMSRLDEARAELDQVLASNPDNVNFRFLDLRLAMRGKDASEIAQRVDNLPQREIPDELAPRWYSELGAALDRLGRPEEAMEAFGRANQASAMVWRRQTSAPNRFLARTDDVLRWTAAQDGWPQAEPADRNPIFVLGFPRSGTTLMGRILHQHSALWAADERPSLRLITDDLENDGTQYPDGIFDLDSAAVAALRDRYFARFSALPADLQLVDKMPLNIVYLPLIRKLFPTARIVCMLRDPRDVVLSCYMQHFALNPAMSRFHRLKDTVSLYDTVQSIWTAAQRLTEAANVHVCRYEALVTDPESTLKEMCRFLDISLEDSMLRPQEAEMKGVITPSLRQVGRPINTDSLSRHQRYAQYLTESKDVLDRWVTRFGYDS